MQQDSVEMETVASTQTLIVRRFSLMPYEPVWRAMQDFTQQRDAETTDEVWLLQHESVFTQGQAGDAEHVLFPGDIPVVQVDRGGQVTYHGPGQLMVYLLLDLRRLKMGARDLVTMIENTLVDTLAGYGIEAHARKDAPGVYVGDAKIASLGLRIRRGSSFHGLALNVDMDLEPFLRINPCGYQGLRMTQIKEFVPDVSWASVADAWLSQFVRAAGFQSVVEQRGLPGDE